MLRERKRVLVTGATGKQGSATVAALLRRGHEVVALTRSPRKAGGLLAMGARVSVGDFGEPASLAAPLRGVDAVFAMSTPEAGVEAEIQQGRALADAAKEAGVAHFVYTSVASANHQTGIAHFESKRRIEEHIGRLGLRRTILRPVFFMENFCQEPFLPGLREGRLRAPLHPDTRVQMISVQDVGEFAAEAISDPGRFVDKELDLAGDAATFAKAAHLLSAALGRRVAFERMPDAEAEASLGPAQARMYRWIDTVGFQVDIEKLRRAHGVALTRLEDAIARMPVLLTAVA